MQFAITTILSFLISIPFMLAKEGSKWGEVSLCMCAMVSLKRP